MLGLERFPVSHRCFRLLSSVSNRMLFWYLVAVVTLALTLLPSFYPLLQERSSIAAAMIGANSSEDEK